MSQSPTKGKAKTMNIREQKGKEIANRITIVQDGNLWLVPSQSGRGKYRVNTDKQTCSCPDYDFRRQKCKHIFAVEETIERTKTVVVEDGKTTVTETVKVTRKTYKQEWPAYNQAQTQEKRLFQYLLRQLCEGVGEPAQTNGRPRLPIEDMLFAMAFKVYSTVSGRRFISDLSDAHGKGYLSKLPAYNSIFRYFEDEMLTPHLQMLIEESSLPLASIEQDFAVDSSGLSTCRFVQWMHAKYSDPHLIEKKDWIKVHIMCGVKTNVITAVEITDRYVNDCPILKPLVEATRRNFVMQEVSADKAYLSSGNLATIINNQAMPYIPFKSNSRPNDKRQSGLWNRMFHFYSYNQERFMKSYHKRSNVETTFHMIKSKFGDALRSRTKTAQINEALCKVLCHNICCLIQSMFELGLKPKFWSEAA
ncbi:MAG TPA: transposase [Pyrinomonadaceae bacterium]|nr:transposase [Pyrinomonadaceae bacterium]